MSSTVQYLNILKEEEKLNRELFNLKIKKVELQKKVWKECIHVWEDVLTIMMMIYVNIFVKNVLYTIMIIYIRN